MTTEELDLLSKKILMLIGYNKVPISKIEYSGLAARQTIHIRIEELIKEGYIREERGTGFPPSRQLSLEDKGLEYLNMVEAQEGVSLIEKIKNETAEKPKTGLSAEQRGLISSIIKTTTRIYKIASFVISTEEINAIILIKFVPLYNAAKNMLDYLQLEFESMNDLPHHQEVSGMIEVDMENWRKGQNLSAKAVMQLLKTTLLPLLSSNIKELGTYILQVDIILKDYPDKARLIRTYAELMSQAFNNISRLLDSQA